MLISDMIANMIEHMLDEGNGSMEFRRNDLAGQLGCVPSQINYVITSRFTPERGYVIESRRGGGGYVRIIRKEMSRNLYLMHVLQSVGEELEERPAAAYLRNLTDNGYLSAREYRLLSGVLSCTAQKKERADMMRQIILCAME